MTPRCGHQWTTQRGAGDVRAGGAEGMTTIRHTCIRRGRHDGHPHMCICGDVPQAGAA